ncbi:N2-acetyl-L-ornithine:2-oxoglutarate 5-aminotransferase [Aureococcus anophagefferens]|nr:N2-acetyl-L-ornithine:2-oxoglutarate 5-aminotransferase [Aureococcus anophagefferens]
MLPRALAAIALAGADAAITWEEAKCVLRGQKVTFFGDSLTRYCFFGLNNFLATGELRADEFSSKQSMGAGRAAATTTASKLERQGILTDQATQRQHAWKTFSDGDFDTRPIETEFYFIQHVWWDDADDTPQEADTPIGSKGHTLADQVAGDATLADVAATLEADVVVYNMGWWQLLKSYSAYECGKGFDAECEAWYDATLARVVDELLDVDGRLGIYRTTSCCGKEIDGDIGAWVAPIEAQNRVAAALMARRGVPVVDIYPLYGLDALDAHTFDDKHANVATCHAWNELILREIDARRNTSCVSGVFTAPGDYAPSASPTRAYAPSAAPAGPSAAPSAFAPSAPPTPGPRRRRRRRGRRRRGRRRRGRRRRRRRPRSRRRRRRPRRRRATRVGAAVVGRAVAAAAGADAAAVRRPVGALRAVAGADAAAAAVGRVRRRRRLAQEGPALEGLRLGVGAPGDAVPRRRRGRRRGGLGGLPAELRLLRPSDAAPAARRRRRRRPARTNGVAQEGAPSKDCAWVAAYAVTRCYVVGDDDRKATAGCRVACGTCSPPPTRAPVVAIPQGCASYFDGCNTCDGSGRSCTEMFCETYEEARCLAYADAAASYSYSYGDRDFVVVDGGGQDDRDARDDDGSVAKTDDDSGGGEAIPAGCTSWYDGCNTCAVTSDAGALACTKKFCDDYGARCLAYGAAGDDDGRRALVVDGRDAAYDDDGHDDGGNVARDDGGSAPRGGGGDGGRGPAPTPGPVEAAASAAAAATTTTTAAARTPRRSGSPPGSRRRRRRRLGAALLYAHRRNKAEAHQFARASPTNPKPEPGFASMSLAVEADDVEACASPVEKARKIRSLSLEGSLTREDLDAKLSELITDLADDYEPTPAPAEPHRERQFAAGALRRGERGRAGERARARRVAAGTPRSARLVRGAVERRLDVEHGDAPRGLAPG